MEKLRNSLYFAKISNIGIKSRIDSGEKFQFLNVTNFEFGGIK